MAISLMDSIGYAAASLTTCSFIPQAVMTWRTKRADGVSLGMYVMFIIGLVLWTVYGVMQNAMPVIASNAVTLTLALFILVMKIVYK